MIGKAELTPQEIRRILAALETIERHLTPSKLEFSVNKTEVVTTRITKDLLEAVRALAKAHGLTVNALIEYLLWRATGQQERLLKG